LKTKKQNISLRELFRQKLEYAEVMPDAAVRSKLMRRIARKEFLHFNPARINIYYLGGFMIAGITSAIMLFTGSENAERLNPVSFQDKLNKSDTSSVIEIPVGKPIKGQHDISLVNRNKSIRNDKVSHLTDKPKTEALKPAESPKNINPPPTGVSNTFSKNSIFTEVTTDNKKLKSGIKFEAFLIDPPGSVGCAPLKVQFHNTAFSYDSCRWTFGDGGNSNQKDPEWIFDVEGDYKVILEVFNHDGQHLSSTALVTVHPRPQAHFEIAPEKAVLPNSEIHFLNYSLNAVHFKWDFGDGSTSELFEPSHIYSKFSNYNVRLVVFSDRGCSDSLTVFNAFSGSEYFIDFPNAFIPNAQGPTGGYYSSKSDEAAQVFHPSFTGVSEYQLKIFSKLGIPIFVSNDINLGWDGYNNGQLCESGVYIWKVRGKFRNGEPFIKMGDVTLLKN
jgi:PKD repeat protein